jgi:hypothetical protein
MTVKETPADLVISVEPLLQGMTMGEMGMKMTEKKTRRMLLLWQQESGLEARALVLGSPGLRMIRII